LTPKTLTPWIVAGAPFILSLGLSAATIGNEVYWQDSGFFLAAIREMGLLYPPGFVLYQVLCRAWTLVLAWVDFTLAVHLFSSVCAAVAAATLALAARGLLRARGGLFKVGEGEPGRVEDWAAAAAGCLAACGYTFWLSGIYAKVYAFYFLLLALLAYWMVRAAEGGRGRDFTVLAAIIGLAWQAHPSAALLGPALAGYVFFHRQAVGWKGIGWRTLVAAGCALGPSLVLIPILGSADSTVSFGSPRGLGEILGYVAGRRFVGGSNVFTGDAERLASVSLYFWEEFLAAGTLAVTAGLVRLGLANRRLLGGMALWVVPFVAVTVLFRMEGQHDFWLVVAWFPLHLAGAVGLREIGRRAGRFAVPAVGALGLAGVVWSAAANFRDLDQRGYRLGRQYGELLLGAAGTNSLLIVTSDDSAASGQYLQSVRGAFPGVLLVRASRLAMEPGGRPGWYEERLLKRDPSLRVPDYELQRRGAGRAPSFLLAAASFANANAGGGREVFFEEPPPDSLIRSDHVLVPAGPLWKLAPKGRESIDLRHWVSPVEPEEVRKGFRRPRAPRLLPRGGGGEVTVFECYEQRLFTALLRSRVWLADWHFRHGKPAEAVPLYESVARLDPKTLELADVVYPLAVIYASRGDPRAEAMMGRALGLDLTPDQRAAIHLQWSDLCTRAGRAAEAEAHLMKAGSLRGLSPEMRLEIEKRSAGR
jgi:hypothetical protein